MMSRMSKFAMPSSTPLYHDAIKTVASSDDDSPPARSPNLPSVNNNGETSEIFVVLICSFNCTSSVHAENTQSLIFVLHLQVW